MNTLIHNLLLTIALAGCTAVASAQVDFNTYFENKSLRIDFALNGNAKEQSAALIGAREEPVWGGPKKNLVDQFNYGGYFVRVHDSATSQVIYSRGFNTLFEEWRTTEQANLEMQSWYNSISIPYPKQTIMLEVLGRNRKDNLFYELMWVAINPKSIFIDRSKLKENKIIQLQHKGDPNGKVDLVFLPEGYTAKETAKFVADAKRFMEALFKTPPFDKYRDDFNIWAVDVPSAESGVDIPGKGIFKNTAFNTGFYTFGIERYMTTRDMKAVHDALWNVPYDAVFILVNTEIYGGGGFYNYYAMGSANNAQTLNVFTHELGHSLAGLSDEYFSSEVAYSDDFYNLKQEPWEPNLTTLVNFSSKWSDLLPPGTPIPTPPEGNEDRVGVYEGGGYQAKGIYRPMVHCMMRDFWPFCPVCSRAIVKMVNFLCDRQQP